MSLPIAKIVYYTMLLERQIELSKDDPEDAHINADDILCDILTELGYESLVERYRLIYKWYS